MSGPVRARRPRQNPFRSLRHADYRLWAGCGLVSNIGSWMQRVAQDWLVLTALTHNNATALGVVMSLQFGPQIVLLPLTGFAADHFDRRKLVMATQAVMGACALLLGLLVVTGWVRLWHVYVIAGVLGSAAAFDTPARQTFISEIVPEEDFASAVALNSTAFNLARMLGPALAGLMIGAVGTGWVFLANGASFALTIGVLLHLRPRDSAPRTRPDADLSSLAAGFRYVWNRPDLRAALMMIGVLGTFGFNSTIFISTMAVRVFHAGASQFGLLSSMMAFGSICGALMAGNRDRPGLRLLVAAAAAFGVACAAAAATPAYALFGVALAGMGWAAQTFNTSTNTLVQLTTAPAMRGRVIALLLALALGTTPIGAPLVGWVADHWGPRWALCIAAVSGAAAALIGWAHLRRGRRSEDSAPQGDLIRPQEPRPPSPTRTRP